MKQHFAQRPLLRPRATSVYLGSSARPAAIERLEYRRLLSTVLVNTIADGVHSAASGIVSLRDAIGAANQSTTPTSITFDSRVFHGQRTIVLTEGTLELSNTTQPITLTGPTRGVRISGDRKTSVFAIASGVVANFSDVVVINGRSSDSTSGGDSGGGISNHGTLTLTHAIITANSTTEDLVNGDAGGGIYSDGVLTLDHCTLTHNIAGYSGGGLQNAGTATLIDCSIAGNNSSIAGSGGAGIYNNNGTLTMAGCTVAKNNCAIGKATPGAGGASGGGIYSGGTATLTNCTIAANVAADTGGIYNIGDLSLFNCTVSANIGGGLADNTAASPTTTLANTILAGNILKAQGYFLDGADVFADVTSNGNNLIGQTDASIVWTASDLTGTIAHPVPAGLAPLANNGGPTPTFRPRSGSLAIAHGSAGAVAAGITTDERGRPRVIAGTVDIGAVEVGGRPAPFITAPVMQNVTAGTPASVQLGSIIATPVTTGPYRVSVNWHDGTPSTHFVVDATGTIAAQAHTFRSGGNYDPLVQITDRFGLASNVAVVPIHSTTSGGTIVVTTASDTSLQSGVVSLRDAIAQANLAISAVTIQFDSAVFGQKQTITLQDGNLELTNTNAPLSIIGPAKGVTIDGGNQTGIFAIDSNVEATFSNLVIADGGSFETSGGIDNAGTLTLSRCVFSNNVASPMTIMGTQFSQTLPNFGGGLYNAGNVMLSECTFKGNSASGGGAIFNSGSATVTDCTFSGNSAGEGGAIDNSGNLSMDDSTFAGNSADNGGAINNSSSLSLVSCTISGNTATQSGGGIVWSTPGSGGSIGNTILAGNVAPSGPDFSGTAPSIGFNLTGQTDGSTGWLSSDLTGTTAHPLDPDLGPLTNNGGSTQTFLPRSASPAIAKGSISILPSTLTTDQRGQPRTHGSSVDIGAVQV